MYRDAQAALYQARVDGKSNIGLFETGAAPKQNRKIKLGTAAIT
jgi:hypothetical protein